MIVQNPTNNTKPAGTLLVNMECVAAGLPAPTLSWYKNGVLLVADNDHIRIKENSHVTRDYGITFGQLQLLTINLK